MKNLKIEILILSPNARMLGKLIRDHKNPVVLRIAEDFDDALRAVREQCFQVYLLEYSEPVLLLFPFIKMCGRSVRIVMIVKETTVEQERSLRNLGVSYIMKAEAVEEELPELLEHIQSMIKITEVIR